MSHYSELSKKLLKMLSNTLTKAPSINREPFKPQTGTNPPTPGRKGPEAN